MARAHCTGEPVLLKDGGGLYFREQMREGAASTFRFRFGGREHWLTLGNVPDMPLAQAREEARQARVLLDRQQDPLAVRRAAKDEQRSRGSFAELCESWFRAEVEGRGLKHPGVPRRYLDKYLLPGLGRSTAEDVTAADIAGLLDGLKTRAPTAANDLLRFARRIFMFGLRRRIVRSNPAADLTPRLEAGGTERPRSRALCQDELATRFEAFRYTPAFGNENLLAIRLLLALCVRKGELLGARWQEFDLEGATDSGPLWRLPATRTKAGEGRAIPLVPAVVEWLRVERTLCRQRVHISEASPRSSATLTARGVDTLNAALQRVDHHLKPFTLHDLRRTAALT